MRLLSPLIIMVSGLLAAAPAWAQAPEGFTPLFNGKDLSGWVLPKDASLFIVEDGVIVGRTKGDLEKNEFLVADKDYANFHLKAEVKLTNGNSGIQFRSTRAADGAVSGAQADVADGYWGLLYEERGRGILERYPEAEAAKIVKPRDWNAFEVIARGNHVQMFINGTKVIDRTDDQFPKTGVIALQVHRGPPMEVRFRNLSIKPLD